MADSYTLKMVLLFTVYWDSFNNTWSLHSPSDLIPTLTSTSTASDFFFYSPSPHSHLTLTLISLIWYMALIWHLQSSLMHLQHHMTTCPSPPIPLTDNTHLAFIALTVLSLLLSDYHLSSTALSWQMSPTPMTLLGQHFRPLTTSTAIATYFTPNNYIFNHPPQTSTFEYPSLHPTHFLLQCITLITGSHIQHNTFWTHFHHTTSHTALFLFDTQTLFYLNYFSKPHHLYTPLAYIRGWQP